MIDLDFEINKLVSLPDVGRPADEEYTKRTNIQQNRAHAKRKGWEVVLPRTDELLIDLDTAEAVKQFDEKFLFATKIFNLEEISRTVSKSGGDKRHVTIRVNDIPLTDIMRVALQAALGSDYRREILSLQHIHKGNNCPTIFFELQKIATTPPVTPPVITDNDAPF